MSARETTRASAQPRLPAATRATYVAFIGCGFAFASWASRIPQVRDRLHLTSAELGLVLLAIAAGSITALLLAGVIVTRFHSRRTVTAMATLQGAALVAVALGYLAGIVPVVVGLFAFGFSAAAWDVAMNVQGAAVERRLGRAIMPRFHAGYSIGTVAGALVGAAMVALHVAVTAHLLAVAVAVAAVIPAAVRSFLPDIEHPDATHGPAQGAADTKGTPAKALRRWAEPRTLLVGIVVLAFAGLLLWGVGASLGFPVGMSAAADDPAAAAGRVSVVASIGYCAFLGGPPLIGYLGQSVTVLRALIAVAVVLALATLVTGALRPLPVHSLPQATPAADPAHPPTFAGDPDVSGAVTSRTARPSPCRSGVTPCE